MSSDRRNRDRRTARGPSERVPRRLLLVVCEGNGTEPDYIHGFNQVSGWYDFHLFKYAH